MGAIMLSHRPLIWRITEFVKRLLSRGPEAGGVPPVGVRQPRHRNPGGRSAAVAVSEPDEYRVTTAKR